MDTIQWIVLEISFPMVYGTPQMDSRIKSQSKLKVTLENMKANKMFKFNPESYKSEFPKAKTRKVGANLRSTIVDISNRQLEVHGTQFIGNQGPGRISNQKLTIPHIGGPKNRQSHLIAMRHISNSNHPNRLQIGNWRFQLVTLKKSQEEYVDKCISSERAENDIRAWSIPRELENQLKFLKSQDYENVSVRPSKMP